MRRADRLAAARALRHLVHAHRLVGPALTVPQARRAQTTASLRRLRVAPLRVPVADDPAAAAARGEARRDRKSTRLNSSHSQISYAVFCLKKKKAGPVERDPD